MATVTYHHITKSHESVFIERTGFHQYILIQQSPGVFVLIEKGAPHSAADCGSTNPHD